MTANHHIHSLSRPERVLVVSVDPDAAAAHRREILSREAELTMVAQPSEAAEAARAQPYDVIIVHARPDASATALLLTLLRIEALGAPRILLLVDPAAAAGNAAAMSVADETMTFALSPRRICDAAGIGAGWGLPQRAAFG